MPLLDRASTTGQFARYLVVGGLAFAIDFGTLYALTESARLHYLASAAIAFVLGLIANYALSRAWVFQRRTLSSTSLEFAAFTAIGVIGLGLNEAGLWLLTERAHLHYMASKVITAGVVFLWNFGARKALLFR
ncbi:MAG TPA: GtrA family protein [Paludibaculum sp.]|jgi:putative flippase GtrA